MSGGLTPAERDAITRQMEEIDTAIRSLADRPPDPDWREWRVDVPPYDRDGVCVERFEVSEREAYVDMLRAVLNPQRADRSVRPGTYTRLTVDDRIWMTDTPAECADLAQVDAAMRSHRSMLLVGLGLGVVLNRAIREHRLALIDVVEIDGRVIDAVAGHYEDLAKHYHCVLHIHHADIHAWRPARGSWWGVGFFDIWRTIDMDDRAEVARLRRRFQGRVGWSAAWAQDERNAQAARIRKGEGWY